MLDLFQHFPLVHCSIYHRPRRLYNGFYKHTLMSLLIELFLNEKGNRPQLLGTWWTHYKAKAVPPNIGKTEHENLYS